jgi:hypothetical protein
MVLDWIPMSRSSKLAGASVEYVRFVVLGDARTGSYMLVQALDSHASVTCFGELFNWDVEYIDYNVPGYDRDSARDLALRNSDPTTFLRERIFCERGAGTQAVGFKLLYSHVWGGFPGLLEALAADRELRVVHLKRRNLLRRLVSTRLAQASGVWRMEAGTAPLPLADPSTWRRGLKDPAGAARALLRRMRPSGGPVAAPNVPAQKSVRLTLQECDEFMYKAMHEVDYYDSLFSGHPSHEIWYEDIVGDQRAAFGAVQSFLGVERKRLVVTMARQNPGPLPELIENYDEVERHYRGTPVERFLQ